MPLGLLTLAFFLGGAVASMKDVMVGGVSAPQTSHSHETLQAAHKAVEHINAKPELLGLLNAQGPVSLGKIVEVKTQVVAGINYFFTLELNHAGKPFQASLVLWSRPWLQEDANALEQPYQITKLQREEPTE